MTTARFDPDSRLLVTAGAEGRVLVHDAGSGATLASLRGAAPAPLAGGLVALAEPDGGVGIYEVASGRRALGLAAAGRAAWSASADGTRLAVAAPGGALAVYSPRGDELCRVAGDAEVYAVALSRGGEVAARARVDRRVEVIDVAGCRVRASFALAGTTRALVLAPGGERIYTDDGARVVWDTQLGQAVSADNWHTGLVTFADFTPTGAHLVTAGEDRTVVLFREPSNPIDMLRGGVAGTTAGALGFDGATVLTGSLDGSARLWSLLRPGLIATYDHGQRLRAARFTPDGGVAALAEDGAVLRWRAGGEVPEVGGKLCAGVCALDADGSRLLRVRGAVAESVSLDGTVGAAVTHAAPVALLRAVDGAWVTSATADGEVVLWDDRDGKVERRLRLPDTLTGVAWSRDRRRLATTGPAGLAVWSADGALVRRFPTLASNETVVTFDMSGARVLGPNETGDAAVWDVKSGKLVAVLDGHVTALTDAAFTPDGAFVATVSSESARLSDAGTGEVVQYFDRPLDYAESGTVVFDAGGTRLLVAGVETWARVWDTAPDRRPLAELRADIECRLRYRVSGSVARLVPAMGGVPMTPREAFQLGLAVARVGVAFRGMDLLDAAGRGQDPQGALAANIANQMAALRARNPDTIQAVFQVEAILGKNGLERPTRPQTLQDFLHWAGAASNTAGASVPQESPAAAALLVGAFLGDLTTSLQLGILALSLLEVARDHQLLGAQVTKLEAATSEAADRLAMAQKHPALHAAAPPIIARIVRLGHGATGGGAGEATTTPGARADARKLLYVAIEVETAKLAAIVAA